MSYPLFQPSFAAFKNLSTIAKHEKQGAKDRLQMTFLGPYYCNGHVTFRAESAQACSSTRA